MEESLNLGSELRCGWNAVRDLVLVISSAGRQVGVQGPPALVAVSCSPHSLQEMTFSKVPDLRGVVLCDVAEKLVRDVLQE